MIDEQVNLGGRRMMPAEPTPELISAMACSKARDDDGDFPMLLDLLDFSGENKTRAVLKAAYQALIAAAPQPPEHFDLIAHIHRARAFSERTFGPGQRTAGVVDHIRKELREIEAAPTDLTEWVDVIILAIDGAWRAGHEPEDIVAAIEAKQTKNEGRTWPDWRTAPKDKAIEHVRHDRPSEQANGLSGTITAEAHERIVKEAVQQAYERAAAACEEQAIIGLIAASHSDREAYALALCHAEDAIRALAQQEASS